MLSAKEQALAIKHYFESKDYRLDHPASENLILSAEKKLGIRIPSVLRELYLLCNGMWDKEHYGYFYLTPLFYAGYGSVENTISMRKLLKNDGKRSIESTGFVFFGGDGCGVDWGMKERDDGSIEIVSFDAEFNDKLMPKGSDYFEFCLENERRWQ